MLALGRFELDQHGALRRRPGAIALQNRKGEAHRVHDGQLYMPMNSSQSPVNVLTSSQSDPVTHTPAYKEVAVSMRVLPEVEESPLPRINHRFGHPTPQRGVALKA